MPNITLINNPDEILNHSQGFQNAVKFESKDRLVTELGNRFSFKYPGWRFRIIDKKTRNYTFMELTARKIFGVVLVVFTLGIILISDYSKYVQNLFTKKCKNLRFAIKESRIDREGRIELSLNETEISKSRETLIGNLGDFKEASKWIKDHKQKIFNRDKIPGIKHHKIKGDNYIFELDIAPGFVFKMAFRSDLTKLRYKNMILAETIVRTHNLGLLIIPRAKIIKLEIDYLSRITQEFPAFIVEEKLNFTPHTASQKALFHRDENTLKEVVRQLAIFICKTGYDDVEWRNNPIMIDNNNMKTDRKIALIDIEHMNQPAMGLFGNCELERTGLIGCTPITCHEMIRGIARDHRIGYVGDDIYNQSVAEKITGGYSYIEATRNKDKILLEDKLNPTILDRLAKWQIDRNILVGNEPVNYKLESQDFLCIEKGVYHPIAYDCHILASEIIKMASNNFALRSPHSFDRVLSLGEIEQINKFNYILKVLLDKGVIFSFEINFNNKEAHIRF